jgi:hypothetical protein
VARATPPRPRRREIFLITSQIRNNLCVLALKKKHQISSSRSRPFRKRRGLHSNGQQLVGSSDSTVPYRKSEVERYRVQFSSGGGLQHLRRARMGYHRGSHARLQLHFDRNMFHWMLHEQIAAARSVEDDAGVYPIRGQDRGHCGGLCAFGTLPVQEQRESGEEVVRRDSEVGSVGWVHQRGQSVAVKDSTQLTHSLESILYFY